MPGDAPMRAAGLPLSALARGGRDSQSMAFFRTPGTPWLYSGVAIKRPSASRTACRSESTALGTVWSSISLVVERNVADLVNLDLRSFRCEFLCSPEQRSIEGCAPETSRDTDDAVWRI